MTIYENENYEVEVGSTKDDDGLRYLVRNKAHRVIEVETNLYPQSIKYADDLNAAIHAVNDMKNEGSSKAKLTSITTPKKAH
jgi:hypothetical protein